MIFSKLSIRVWILIIILLLAFLSIAPWHMLNKGVVIKSVEKNSTALEAGLKSGMILKTLNQHPIATVDDYFDILSTILASGNNTKITIVTDKGEFIMFTDKAPEISLVNIPKTNIKTGLDLSGGARALVKAENVSLTQSQLSDLISITSQRFNVFGLSDMTIKPVTDLDGNNYMSVEIAGATSSDLRYLVGQQGKFEAKIGNETVFIGGEKDITSVCRTDATCSRIQSCNQIQSGFACRFEFVIYLSEEAAKRHADITGKLNVNMTESGRYLDKKLDLLVDDNLMDSLLISEDLKGRVTTQIAVSGSGTGATQADAYNSALENMKKLQTILITGSLPYKLEIVKLDTISPNLGSEFTKNIIYLGLIVFVIISIILFIRYRKIKITSAIILTMFSEAFITLGIMALFSKIWTLDSAGIAGIIAGMGTGVNDQIVIIDEAISSVNLQLTLKDKIKNAFSIILGAFFTIVAAMLPLLWAGAGMLKGFAITTIITVMVGIIITRPAFADILRKIQE